LTKGIAERMGGIDRNQANIAIGVVAAIAQPIAAATVVLPTPPLPPIKINFRS
jgi:hypothetical protein